MVNMAGKQRGQRAGLRLNKISGVRGSLFKDRHFWPQGLDVEPLKDLKSVKGIKV